MFFPFKTVGELQVIHEPLSRPKQMSWGVCGWHKNWIGKG
jgi:hypothetical protein